jgi:ATP-binding cassette subfamily C protein
VPREEFDAGYSGVTLTFEPGPEFRKSGRPARLLPALWSRLRGHGLALLFGLLAGLLLVLPLLAVPMLSSTFIDKVLLERQFDLFRPILWAMGAAIAFLMLGLMLQLRVLRRLQLTMAAKMGSQFLWHLLRLPMAFYLQRFAGEVSARQALTVEAANILSGKLVGTVLAILTLFIYTALMALVSWQLAALGVGMILVNLLALWVVYPRRREAALRRSRDLGRAAGVAMAGLQGIETLKAGGLETGFFGRWVAGYSQATAAEQQLQRLSLGVGVFPDFLDTLTATLLLLIGGSLMMAGQMTLGLLVAFQALLHKMLEPVNTLVRQGGSIQELEADLFRLDDVLDYPAEPTPARSASEGHAEPSLALRAGVGPAKLAGHVEARALSFGYSPLEPPLFEGCGLRVEPGQWVALVGASGSGKSTLLRLLAGLYRPWQGAVLLDGRPRDEYPAEVVAGSVGYVDQDIVLFEGTVRDNLTLWDRTLTDEQLWAACRDACVADVLQALPGGLDAVLLEGGANLSVGQRQRLEIARALATGPAVLLLDEASSALDSETERAVLENLRRRRCTCILAAHRVSTIRDSDEIIVLDHGQVVERGRHDELWAAQGEYARLLQRGGDGE